ncbi:MAG TPA: hypothetical protein VN026_10770 [Bacteroidia bacterium]|jgi:hypothetical protein|nr:hypothetical protein [Bacteroidia bacterium]
MKLLQILMSSNSQTVLCLIIVIANIDYIGIADYCIKAVLGSLIWFGFKMLSDKYSDKQKKELDNDDINDLNK